jgi:hypothetical protein
MFTLTPLNCKNKTNKIKIYGFCFFYKFGLKRKEKKLFGKTSIKWEIIALAVVQ